MSRAPSRATISKRSREARDKINILKIIDKLQDHIDNGGLMDSSQIKAADILLNKALPNLASMTFTDEEGKSVTPVHLYLPDNGRDKK